MKQIPFQKRADVVKKMISRILLSTQAESGGAEFYYLDELTQDLGKIILRQQSVEISEEMPFDPLRPLSPIEDRGMVEPSEEAIDSNALARILQTELRGDYSAAASDAIDNASKTAEDTLGRTRKELEKLAIALRESKRAERVGRRLSIPGVCTIEEVGRSDSPEALVATPLNNGTFIPESLPDYGYRTEDEWYPFEIVKRGGNPDLQFFLDDDGSIYVSIERLGSDGRAAAGEQLHELARIVYGYD